MMRLLWVVLLFVGLYSAKAQQKSFEGIVTYDTKLTSKLPEVSDESWKRYLFLGDSVTVYIRRNFYRHSFPSRDVYFNPEQQKVFLKYKGIDSLFYIDYLADTSNKVMEVVKYDELIMVNGIKCNSLKVETQQSTTSYSYSPTMYVDPAMDKNNTDGRYDAYIEVAKAVYLQFNSEGSSYGFKQTATRIESRSLDDSIFKMPDLPITKFNPNSIRTAPQFKDGLDGYKRFLLKNLNGNLANYHIKIPTGEKSAMAVVRVMFVVTEEGKIADVEVLNKMEVPVALAEEAVRVTSKIPRLKPAMFDGKKIPYMFVNNITFMAERQ